MLALYSNRGQEQMSSTNQNPAPRDISAAAASWLQTRAVLRIILLVLALAALLWVVYRLTTVILLVVLSVFFAYLVAPLVDLVQRPIRFERCDVTSYVRKHAHPIPNKGPATRSS